jgi:GAF domain-containing protein
MRSEREGAFWVEISADGRGRRRLYRTREGPRSLFERQEEWLPGRVRRLRALALRETSAAFTAAGSANQAAFDALAGRLANRLDGGCVIRPCAGADAADGIPVAADFVRPDGRELLKALMRTSPTALGSAYCAWVIERERSMLTSDVSWKALRRWTDKAAWPFLEACDIFTFLVVPVRSSERVVGTLAVWRERPGQSLDEDDRVFAEEVGRRLLPV